jgi:hypothetical protein
MSSLAEVQNIPLHFDLLFKVPFNINFFENDVHPGAFSLLLL